MGIQLNDLSFGNSKEENKKMPWQETATQLEEAVKEALEKEETLNEKTAEYNIAVAEHGKAVAYVDNLRNQLNNELGGMFNKNPRVQVFGS